MQQGSRQTVRFLKLIFVVSVVNLVATGEGYARNWQPNPLRTGNGHNCSVNYQMYLKSAKAKFFATTNGVAPSSAKHCGWDAIEQYALARCNNYSYSYSCKVIARK